MVRECDVSEEVDTPRKFPYRELPRMEFEPTLAPEPRTDRDEERRECVRIIVEDDDIIRIPNVVR